MFSRISKLLKSPTSLTLLSIFSYSYLNSHYNNSYTNSHIQNIYKYLTYPLSISNINCMQAIRANKPQLMKLINSTKQQILLLIYNKQSQQQLRKQILQYCEIAKKLNIDKVVLVDQTDIRHLQTFARLLRENIQDDQDKQNKDKTHNNSNGNGNGNSNGNNKKNNNKQPIDLQGKINILYIHPTYNTNKPFTITNSQTLPQQIKQIRQYLKQNPQLSQLQTSINTYNKTTVIKNCYNSTCVQQYKQKIRQLIQLQLLRGKIQNYGFYVTNTKTQANKIGEVIGQTSNKQQIYVFRNDILGKDRELNSRFQEKQGNKYENVNKFMMLIRPRVHVIGRKNMTTDLFWYMSSVKISGGFTFAINNTLRNLPVRIINNSYLSNKQQLSNKQNNNNNNSQQVSTKQINNNNNNNKIVYIKGHYKQLQLLQKIKQKYNNKIQLLILQSTIPSQLFRHIYCSQRYSIFRLTPQLPYPKMLIKPTIINMDMNIWDNINFRKYYMEDININIKNNNNNNNKIELQGDNENYNEKWNKIYNKIDTFINKPINYNNIKMYRQKQLQINAQDLANLISNKAMPYNNNNSENNENNNNNKWIFRVCGSSNNCLYSVYQKYGIDINIPVYWLDSNVQNIAVDQGDYQVQNGQIKILQ